MAIILAIQHVNKHFNTKPVLGFKKQKISNKEYLGGE